MFPFFPAFEAFYAASVMRLCRTYSNSCLYFDKRNRKGKTSSRLYDIVVLNWGKTQMNTIGIQALITLITYILFIAMAFWTVQEIHIERYIPLRAMPGKLLIVLVSIAIGYACSSFFLSVIFNIQNLMYLIK